MAYFECQCPNCSLPTVFNDGRLQCYCINWRTPTDSSPS